MAEAVQIRGVEEIQRRLRELETRTAKKATRTALRAGAKIILDEARATAPVRTGLVRRAIKVKAGKSSKGMVSVLVQLGSKMFAGKSFYGAFVNFGHFMGKRLAGRWRGAERKERYTAASVAAGRVFVPGTHWMERSFESKKNLALEVAQGKLIELIEEEAKQ